MIKLLCNLLDHYLGENMNLVPYVAQILPVYTPDGGVADPNHPIYALVWLVLHLLGVA